MIDTTIDLQYETARRESSARIRVVYEGLWARTDAPESGGRLRGPFGEMFRRSLRAHFHGGPKTRKGDPTRDEPAEVPIASDLRIRWKQLEALADLSESANPLQLATEQLDLLYRKPSAIGGDVATPAFAWLRERCGYDGHQQAKLKAMIGQQVIITRPTLTPYKSGQYRPAGLTLVTADNAIAVEDPSSPHTPLVFLEWRPVARHWLVWDMRDPLTPRFGAWSSPDDWQHGGRPLWVLEGPAYPWTYAGEPIMPIVIERWRPASGNPLSVNPGIAESVLDLMKARLWCLFVERAGSFEKALLFSDQPLEGGGTASMDPTPILNLFNGGQVSSLVLSASTASSERLMESYRGRMLEWARRFNAGISLRETSAVKSGTALMLELTGAEQLAQQLETKALAPDTAILQALIATHNYLVRSGQCGVVESPTRPGTFRWIPGAVPSMSALIPEGDIEITYRRQWNAIERQAIRTRLETAVDKGMADPRELYCLDHDLDWDGPDGPNAQAADEALTGILARSMGYAEQGMGLSWAQRAAIARDTVDDEEARYDVPADVANTAAEGLRLRDETGMGPNGMKPEGKRLLARSRKLRDQTPFLLGEIRALDTWLKAHESDADAEGAQPTGPGITFLTQGGAPARAWTEFILLTPPTAPEPPQPPTTETAEATV